MGQVTASPFRPPRFAPFPKGRRAKREAGPVSRLNRNNTKRAKREAGEARALRLTDVSRDSRNVPKREPRTFPRFPQQL